MTSYTISRWRPRRLHTTSGFVLINVIVFGRSNSTWKPNFIQIGPPAVTVWPLIDFQDGSRGGAILLPVSCRMMSLSSEDHHLSANQISSTYVNPRLRYNYFQFRKTSNVDFDHITILGISLCMRCRISSKSVHPQRRYDVIWILKMEPLRRNFTSGFGFGDVALFKMSVSISQPNFVVIAQSTAEI